MLTSMSKYQECSPTAGQHIYIDVPLRIEPLYTGRGNQTRLLRLQQTRHPASIARMHATCPWAFESQQSKSSTTDASVAWRFARPTIDRHGPIRSKRRFSATWRVRRESNRHALRLSSPRPAELLTSSPTDADARHLSLQHHRVRRLLLSSARTRVSHQMLTSASDAPETSVRRLLQLCLLFHPSAQWKISVLSSRKRLNPSLPLKLHHLRKCANTTKCTSPCACVLAFSQSFFKALR
jgi:hypothetical protein